MDTKPFVILIFTCIHAWIYRVLLIKKHTHDNTEYKWLVIKNGKQHNFHQSTEKVNLYPALETPSKTFSKKIQGDGGQSNPALSR